MRRQRRNQAQREARVAVAPSCNINLHSGDSPYLYLGVKGVDLYLNFTQMEYGVPQEGTEWESDLDREEFPDREIKEYSRLIVLDHDRQIVIKNIDIHGTEFIYQKRSGHNMETTIRIQLTEAEAWGLADVLDEEVEVCLGRRNLPGEQKTVKLFGSCAAFPMIFREIVRRSQ